MRIFTDPQFSNPLRRAIKSACCRSCTPRSLTRNELVKTWGRDEPNRLAVAGGGAEDDATVTRTTVKLASSRVQQTDGDVPALQEREVALNMARGLETSRTVGILPPVLLSRLSDKLLASERINRRPLRLLERIGGIFQNACFSFSPSESVAPIENSQ